MFKVPICLSKHPANSCQMNWMYCQCIGMFH